MSRAWPCLTLLTLAACSSSPAAPDLRPADLALAERGPDRAADDLRRDLAADKPRPPARWETVPGAKLSLIDHTMTTLANGDVLIVGGLTDDGAGTGSYLYQRKAYRFLADQGTLVDAGELTDARAKHRAVLLADGRVLVLGGDGATDFLASAEIYDPSKPASAAWSTAAPMPSDLKGFSASRLANGDVMIAGGTSNGIESVSTIFLYKPDGAWKIPFATLGEARRHHAAIVLANGKVVVSGGMTGEEKLGKGTFRSSMEVYDPASGAFSPGKPLPSPRAHHFMIPLADGRVLIVGGNCGANCLLQGHLIFDPGADILTPISHPGGNSMVEIAVALPGGRAVLLGDSNFVFGVGVAGGWDPLPGMPTPRYLHNAALLKNGSVLVAGGLLDGPAKITHAEPLERLYP